MLVSWKPCVSLVIFTFGALLRSGAPFEGNLACRVGCREQIQFYQLYCRGSPSLSYPSVLLLISSYFCCPQKSEPQKCSFWVSYLVLSGSYLLLEMERLLFQRQTVFQQLLFVPQSVLLKQQPLHLNKNTNVTPEEDSWRVSSSDALVSAAWAKHLPGCRGCSAETEAALLHRKLLLSWFVHTAPGPRSNGCLSPPDGSTGHESEPPERRRDALNISWTGGERQFGDNTSAVEERVAWL